MVRKKRKERDMSVAYVNYSLVDMLKKAGLRIAVAESCTGGKVSDAIVSIPGSSAVFEYGAIVYSNRMKIDKLSVDAEIIDKYTEVSACCAKAMARGVMEKSGADIGLSTTGYAGPDGDDVGLVYIGVATENGADAYKFRFSGSRENVRDNAMKAAIGIALRCAMRMAKKSEP